MSRPIRPRRIRHFKKYPAFRPDGNHWNSLAVTLTLDEIEALRLKDLDKLSQDEMAEMMDVSRQTVRLILERAREKITTALTEEYVLHIEGGSYIIHECEFHCTNCGQNFPLRCDDSLQRCIHCGSRETYCIFDGPCRGFCQRYPEFGKPELVPIKLNKK